MSCVSLWRYFPLALSVALIGACSSSEPTNIRLAEVGLADVAEVVEAPATVAARATATVRAPAEGTLDEVRVSDGERVKKGELLARIDSPTAREQLAQAREADRLAAGTGGGAPEVDIGSFRVRADRTARRGFRTAREAAQKIPDPERRARAVKEIAKAEGQYAGAAAAAHQAVTRVNQGIGSLSSAMASITAAQRVQTKAAVRAAERTVDGLEVRAPFSGVVGLGGPAGGDGGLSGLLGALPPQLQGQAAQAAGAAGGAGAPPVGPGGGLGGGGATDATSIAEGAPISSGAAVATVTDVSKLRLSADVDETDVLLVRRGVRATVEFDAVPGASYPAEVIGVGVTPVQSGGGGVSYKVTLSLEPGTDASGRPAPWPKPGMSAVADIQVRQASGAVAVPASAVVSSGRDTTVWVIAGGRAQRRVVRLGAEGEAMVQVAAGLRTGERVVVRGADSVRTGQQVP
jgi:HlyD family secretion protein